jgi:hypothetical protein
VRLPGGNIVYPLDDLRSFIAKLTVQEGRLPRPHPGRMPGGKNRPKVKPVDWSVRLYGARSQHFLLTAKARTLSLKSIMRMTDDEAHDRFEQIRFADNGGAAFCPYCECTKVYTYRARKIWECAASLRQFSVTSGTILEVVGQIRTGR